MKTKTVLCLTFLILLIFHFSPLVCFALTDEEIQKFQSLLKAQPVGERKFDLIICDVMMPNKTGWEVVKKIKSSPKLNHIPIIVLTAKNEDSDMFKGYELGASYYLTKPFTKAQLLYGLQLIFERKGESLPMAGRPPTPACRNACLLQAGTPACRHEP